MTGVLPCVFRANSAKQAFDEAPRRAPTRFSDAAAYGSSTLPHFYCQNVFEADFFDAIRSAMPNSEHYGSMAERTANPRAKSREYSHFQWISWIICLRNNASFGWKWQNFPVRRIYGHRVKRLQPLSRRS